MFPRPAIIYCVLIFLAACGDEREVQNVASSSVITQGIIHGNACRSLEHPSAVALIYDLELQEISDKSIRHVVNVNCGGTLIAPDVVLTAAHCAHPPDFGHAEYRVVSFKLYVSPDADLAMRNLPSTSELQDFATRVKSHRIHSGYSASSFNGRGLGAHHDIALLFLDDPIDLPSSQIASPEEARNIASGTKVNIVGWGAQEGARLSGVYSGTLGVKRCGQSFVNEVGPFEMQIGADRESVRKCSGDSGSATYASFTTEEGPQTRLIGITSHSYSGPGCLVGGVDTRVDVYFDWINRTMKEGCEKNERRSCQNDEPPSEEPTFFGWLTSTLSAMVSRVTT